jgi:ABC-type lipoprotein export system ATPase subunit
MTVPLVEVSSAAAQYGTSTPIHLPDIRLAAKQHTLLLGPSGSGKSTLLSVIAGIQQTIAGSISVNGQALEKLSTAERDRLRGSTIGFIMQRLHLIAALNVRDNLALTQRLAGMAVDRHFIEHTAASLGVADKLDRYPGQLSQGEAQRVAIARTLMNKPKLILADEPTSALDDINAEKAILLLLNHANEAGATLLVATHDSRIKQHFNNVITLGSAVAATQLAITPTPCA